MPTTLPTNRVLARADQLSVEGFAATVAAVHDLDTALVYSVLCGAAPSKVLPVAAARTVCGFIAERFGLDAAEATLAGDRRVTAANAVNEHRAHLEAQAQLAEAATFTWDRDAVLDEVAASVAARVEDPTRDVPRWPQGPSTKTANATVSPPEELRRDVTVALFDGRIPELDPTSERFDAVAALLAVAPLARSLNVSELLSADNAGHVDVRVGAVLGAPHVRPSALVVSKLLELRTGVLDALTELAAATARRYPDLSAASSVQGMHLLDFGTSVAAVTVMRDHDAAFDGRAAACVGVDSFDALGVAPLNQVLKLLGECGGAGRAAAAEVAVAATRNGTLRQPVMLRKLHGPLAAKGPAVCAALTPSPAVLPVRRTWLKDMCTAACGWSEEAFEEAARLHPAELDAMLGEIDTLTTGAPPPRWLAYASMRTVGLAEWLRRDDATVEELISAAAGLDVDGWSALWVLVTQFKGTPAELVAVAAETS